MFKQCLCSSSISSPIANDLFKSWAHAARDPGNPTAHNAQRRSWTNCGWSKLLSALLGLAALGLWPASWKSSPGPAARAQIHSAASAHSPSPAASGGLPRENSHSGARGPWPLDVFQVPRPSTIPCARIILNTAFHSLSLRIHDRLTRQAPRTNGCYTWCQNHAQSPKSRAEVLHRLAQLLHVVHSSNHWFQFRVLQAVRRTTHALVSASGNVLRKNEKSERTTLGIHLDFHLGSPNKSANPTSGTSPRQSLLGLKRPATKAA